LVEIALPAGRQALVLKLKTKKMIKFFRKIRYDFMNQNKTSKYLKYAIGEIVLVVIGILIALQINNWNEERKLNNDRSTLITNLKQELNENLMQFTRRTNRLTDVNKKLIEVLNFSASVSTNKPIDSLKTYVTNTFTFPAAVLNNSRLSSAKSSGKFSLLSEDITTSLTDCEASINNYSKFTEISSLTFQDDWSNLVIRLNSLQRFHNIYYPQTDLKIHPEFVLDDEAVNLYLKEPQTYELLHKYYVQHMVEQAWLEELIVRINSTLQTIEQEQL
jgi:hypothetical protein